MTDDIHAIRSGSLTAIVKVQATEAIAPFH